MCKKSGETPDHLFLHRDVARDSWIIDFQMFGVDGLCLDGGGGPFGMLD